jgi:hypothetical protein
MSHSRKRHAFGLPQIVSDDEGDKPQSGFVIRSAYFPAEIFFGFVLVQARQLGIPPRDGGNAGAQCRGLVRDFRPLTGG